MEKYKHSYHNHTARCHHAVGEMSEYAEAAARAGYETFGFCDHAPHPFEGGYVSSVRMEMSELPEYVREIRLIKERYSSLMDIKAGLEMEYYPCFFEKEIKKYTEAGIEYLILGQHRVGVESLPGAKDCFMATEDAKTLHRYVDQCTEGISTGVYSYIAHPDVCHFVGDDDLYREEMSRLILAAKKNDMPLEINLLGLCGGRFYPRELFWECASRLGASAIIGVDAHSPSRVYIEEEIQAGLRFADKYKLNLVERPDTEKLKRIMEKFK